jgi:hypothetical protein
MTVESHVYMLSKKVNTNLSFTPTGVFLISVKDDLYAWFDTFAIKTNIKESNKLSEKKTGETYNRIDPIYNVGRQNAILRDTLVQGNKLYYRVYSDTLLPDFGRTVVKDYFIKKSNFVSKYTVLGALPVDREYNLVGNSITTFGKKSEVLFLLEDIRRLTGKEARVCKSLIAQARAHNVKMK